MALTKVTGSGVEGITNLSNATFLSVDASEVATLLTSAVINSEGGAVTTNIAHGLAKAHTVTVQIDTQASGSMSLNISGVTDNGAGRSDIAFSSNFSSAAYSVVGMSRDGGGYNDVATISNSSATYTTSNFEIFCCHSASDGSGTANDSSTAYTAYFGDLA